MRVTGTGFLIKLRPKNETDPGTGFPGAKTAYLRRDVHIVINDVGRSGILPGTARPEQAQGDKTPLDLRCAGQMQVDLPRERRYPPTFVGPPQPPGTTLATFTRDVVVLRGKLHQMPDQLNCDDLRLILIPAEKAPAARAGPRAEPGTDDLLAAAPDPSQEQDSGGGSALTLRRAEATGHAVWLQSKSDGLTVRCNELIHKKLTPEQADETYFRGDATTRLQVEKLELVKDGPDTGKVQSVMTIRTTDATIFDDGQNKNDATVVARGPGVLEIRPARDRPVERKATWDDQLILQTEEVVGRAVQKKITLTRNPKLVDLTRGTLDARAKIVIWLKPKPRAAVAAAAPGIGNTATASRSAAESYEIDMLRAWERVHLAAPNRTMDARDLLEVKFESPTPVARREPRPRAEAGRQPGAGRARRRGSGGLRLQLRLRRRPPTPSRRRSGKWRRSRPPTPTCSSRRTGSGPRSACIRTRGRRPPPRRAVRTRSPAPSRRSRWSCSGARSTSTRTPSPASSAASTSSATRSTSSARVRAARSSPSTSATPMPPGPPRARPGRCRRPGSPPRNSPPPARRSASIR